MTVPPPGSLKAGAAAALSGSLPRAARSADNAGVYDLERFGNARILHTTDTHAQLKPVYFREPSVNLGVGAMAGKPPHLVGKAFLDRFGIRPDSADAYAFTCIEFEKSAARFGKLGGYAYLKTLIDRLRSERRTRPLAAARWRRPLAGALGSPTPCRAPTWWKPSNLLGIEAMTGHWEFTYGEAALRKNLARFKGEFLAQNVFLTEEAAFNDAKAFDPASGRVFKPSGHQGNRRLPYRGDRAGLSLRADRASKAFYAGLEVRHPRRGAAKTGRRASRHRQGRCRDPAVA